jgi:hypothetical protein
VVFWQETFGASYPIALRENRVPEKKTIGAKRASPKDRNVYQRDKEGRTVHRK